MSTSEPAKSKMQARLEKGFAKLAFREGAAKAEHVKRFREEFEKNIQGTPDIEAKLLDFDRQHRLVNPTPSELGKMARAGRYVNATVAQKVMEQRVAASGARANAAPTPVMSEAERRAREDEMFRKMSGTSSQGQSAGNASSEGPDAQTEEQKAIVRQLSGQTDDVRANSIIPADIKAERVPSALMKKYKEVHGRTIANSSGFSTDSVDTQELLSLEAEMRVAQKNPGKWNKEHNKPKGDVWIPKDDAGEFTMPSGKKMNLMKGSATGNALRMVMAVSRQAWSLGSHGTEKQRSAYIEGIQNETRHLQELAGKLQKSGSVYSKQVSRVAEAEHVKAKESKGGWQRGKKGGEFRVLKSGEKDYKKKGS